MQSAKRPRQQKPPAEGDGTSDDEATPEDGDMAEQPGEGSADEEADEEADEDADD